MAMVGDITTTVKKGRQAGWVNKQSMYMRCPWALYLGTGCGAVGRAVTSDTKRHGFESTITSKNANLERNNFWTWL